jgi:sigma-E factor negative regulatory protein RseA
MAHEHEEKLSALVDGELEHRQVDELLARVREDDELRARWASYHLISDALHNNLSQGVDLDISRRVSAAIEQEPVIFAPIWQRLRPSRKLIKQAAGAAVAASVTAVALLGAQWVNLGPGAMVADGTGTLPTTQLVAEAPSAQDGSSAALVALDQGNGDGNEQVWAHSLDSYVVNHNEYAGSTGMHGVLPYARLVSYESRQ